MTFIAVAALVAVAAATAGFVLGRRFHHWSFKVEVDRNGHDHE